MGVPGSDHVHNPCTAAAVHSIIMHRRIADSARRIMCEQADRGHGASHGRRDDGDVVIMGVVAEASMESVCSAGLSVRRARDGGHHVAAFVRCA